MERIASHTIVFLSYVLGMGSLILLVLFFYLGSFTLFDMGLGRQEALILDAGLCLLFFIQHSVMIRRGIREKLSKLIPDAYYSAFYAICSGIALLSLMILWQKTSVIATADGMYHIMLRALPLLAIAGFAWGVSSLGAFDPLGIGKIRRHIHNKETRPMPLAVRGAYRWMRHPLYFFCLVIIWSCPDLTADRLLFNILWTMWIWIGTLLEERDLVADFGESYRLYQARVPMIIPYKIPK